MRDCLNDLEVFNRNLLFEALLHELDLRNNAPIPMILG